MIVNIDRHGTFTMDEEFLRPYRERPAPWGYGALSWVTFKRTYSRDGEAWWGTCRRVVEGMFTVWRVHMLEAGLPWDDDRARALSREAYARLFRFKWMPPGRGLWIMGTRHMYDRGGAALNNCGFVSTRDLAHDYAGPFSWMLGMSMLGVGVGFDTRGVGTVTIQTPRRDEDVHVIADSREGWGEAMARLLSAHVGQATLPARWDFSRIRPAGTPLRSFGGVASGPEPLQEMLVALEALHAGYIGRAADARLLVDAMNIVGRCVVAGGVRRSAQIAFGEPTDEQFLDLKQDPDKLREYRWASNNSVLARVGMDYEEVSRRTRSNGEPGYLWLENARTHGRMADPPDHRDEQAMGSNPCVEQTLWDRELCCLVETYPAHHESARDFMTTLELAYMYAKAVTLVQTHDARTNRVMAQNRRIGCSMTGIVQAIQRHGYRRFLRWCDQGYAHLRRLDEEHSPRLGVNRSIKLTSVKPSGTVSLLAGATPGVHWEHAPYYLRRIRVAEGHPLVRRCEEAGYEVEPDAYSARTVVISFPVHVRDAGRRKAEVTLREKLDLAAQLQRYWADNQVSCTAEFDPESEAAEVPRLLEAYEDRLKGISLLPSSGHGYRQAPYEEITRARYEEQLSQLRPLTGDLEHEHELEARFCEGGVCDLE